MASAVKLRTPEFRSHPLRSPCRDGESCAAMFQERFRHLAIRAAFPGHRIEDGLDNKITPSNCLMKIAETLPADPPPDEISRETNRMRCEGGIRPFTPSPKYNWPCAASTLYTRSCGPEKKS